MLRGYDDDEDDDDDHADDGVDDDDDDDDHDDGDDGDGDDDDDDDDDDDGVGDDDDDDDHGEGLMMMMMMMVLVMMMVMVVVVVMMMVVMMMVLVVMVIVVVMMLMMMMIGRCIMPRFVAGTAGAYHYCVPTCPQRYHALALFHRYHQESDKALDIWKRSAKQIWCYSCSVQTWDIRNSRSFEWEIFAVFLFVVLLFCQFLVGTWTFITFLFKGILRFRCALLSSFYEPVRLHSSVFLGANFICLLFLVFLSRLGYNDISDALFPGLLFVANFLTRLVVHRAFGLPCSILQGSVCRVLSCRVVSFRFVSCLVVSCLVVCCRLVSCVVVSSRVLSCRLVSCLVVSYRVLSFRFVSCRDLCRVVFCRVINVVSYLVPVYRYPPPLSF